MRVGSIPNQIPDNKIAFKIPRMHYIIHNHCYMIHTFVELTIWNKSPQSENTFLTFYQFTFKKNLDNPKTTKTKFDFTSCWTCKSSRILNKIKFKLKSKIKIWLKCNLWRGDFQNYLAYPLNLISKSLISILNSKQKEYETSS